MEQESPVIGILKTPRFLGVRAQPLEIEMNFGPLLNQKIGPPKRGGAFFGDCLPLLLTVLLLFTKKHVDTAFWRRNRWPHGASHYFGVKFGGVYLLEQIIVQYFDVATLFE